MKTATPLATRDVLLCVYKTPRGFGSEAHGLSAFATGGNVPDLLENAKQLLRATIESRLQRGLAITEHPEPPPFDAANVEGFHSMQTLTVAYSPISYSRHKL
jgi:hypothetical protein